MPSENFNALLTQLSDAKRILQENEEKPGTLSADDQNRAARFQQLANESAEEYKRLANVNDCLQIGLRAIHVWSLYPEHQPLISKLITTTQEQARALADKASESKNFNRIPALEEDERQISHSLFALIPELNARLGYLTEKQNREGSLPKTPVNEFEEYKQLAEIRTSLKALMTLEEEEVEKARDILKDSDQIGPLGPLKKSQVKQLRELVRHRDTIDQTAILGFEVAFALNDLDINGQVSQEALEHLYNQRLPGDSESSAFGMQGGIISNSAGVADGAVKFNSSTNNVSITSICSGQNILGEPFKGGGDEHKAAKNTLKHSLKVLVLLKHHRGEDTKAEDKLLPIPDMKAMVNKFLGKPKKTTIEVKPPELAPYIQGIYAEALADVKKAAAESKDPNDPNAKFARQLAAMMENVEVKPAQTPLKKLIGKIFGLALPIGMWYFDIGSTMTILAIPGVGLLGLPAILSAVPLSLLMTGVKLVFDAFKSTFDAGRDALCSSYTKRPGWIRGSNFQNKTDELLDDKTQTKYHQLKEEQQARTKSTDFWSAPISAPKPPPHESVTFQSDEKAGQPPTPPLPPPFNPFS